MPDKKKVVVYIRDERMYKTLKHRCVDEGLSTSALVFRLIKQYLDVVDNSHVTPKSSAVASEVPQTKEPIEDKEAEFWRNEAKAFDNAMPLHPRQKKGPRVEPVEKSIKI